MGDLASFLGFRDSVIVVVIIGCSRIDFVSRVLVIKAFFSLFSLPFLFLDLFQQS